MIYTNENWKPPVTYWEPNKVEVQKMNKEEAITLLEKLRTFHNGTYAKAIDIAIEALEAEPKILETIDFAIDASNGGTNYYVGFRNGLRYAKSLVDGAEPQFENCAEQEPKHGKWQVDEAECIYGKKYIMTCSECGESVSVTEAALPYEKHFPTQSI